VQKRGRSLFAQRSSNFILVIELRIFKNHRLQVTVPFPSSLVAQSTNSGESKYGRQADLLVGFMVANVIAVILVAVYLHS
jgi:hypothetical protein